MKKATVIQKVLRMRFEDIYGSYNKQELSMKAAEILGTSVPQLSEITRTDPSVLFRKSPHNGGRQYFLVRTDLPNLAVSIY